MLDLLSMKVGQAIQDLFCVMTNCDFIEVAKLRENVCEARIHLLKIDAEELIKKFTAKELNYIIVIKLFVFLNLVLLIEKQGIYK